MIRAIVPEEVIGGDRPAIQPFYTDIGRVDKQVVQGDQVVPTGQAVIVANKDVIEEMDGFKEAGSPVILLRIRIVHQSQSGHLTGLNDVSLDQKEAIRWARIVDQLNAILMAAKDGVTADDDVQGWTLIIVKPDLDPIVVTVADDIALDDHFGEAVQIYGIVIVVVKDIVAAGPTPGLVVNGIDVADKMVVENLELCVGTDSVATVLDGEAYDLGLGTDG